jgi:hypothetical protein
MSAPVLYRYNTIQYNTVPYVRSHIVKELKKQLIIFIGNPMNYMTGPDSAISGVEQVPVIIDFHWENGK